MRNKTENPFSVYKAQNWINCWKNAFYDRIPERFVTHLLLFLLFLRTWDWKTGNAAAHKRRVQDIFRRNLIRWWPKTMISLMHQRNAELLERSGRGGMPLPFRFWQIIVNLISNRGYNYAHYIITSIPLWFSDLPTALKHTGAAVGEMNMYVERYKASGSFPSAAGLHPKIC